VLITLSILVGAMGCQSSGIRGVEAPTESRTGSVDTPGNKKTGFFCPNLPELVLETVYFDYDSYSLRPDTLATLNENAKKIKEWDSSTRKLLSILIEGHCDERGTQEYNLALGERRASAVEEYLVRLGVSSELLGAISYGKEQPAAAEHNEEAWAKNRRCEFRTALYQ
jgi:peptidoglycan-associated lipoprotein